MKIKFGFKKPIRQWSFFFKQWMSLKLKAEMAITAVYISGKQTLPCFLLHYDWIWTQISFFQIACHVFKIQNKDRKNERQKNKFVMKNTHLIIVIKPCRGSTGKHERCVKTSNFQKKWRHFQSSFQLLLKTKKVIAHWSFIMDRFIG